MYPTIEVRWFLKGVVPLSVWTWYGRWGADLGQQPARVDYYLRIIGGDSLGVKLREGRIEIKQRYGKREIVRFAEGAAGTVEHWRKWSFPLVESGDLLAGLRDSSSSWIGVRKERALRLFQVMEGGAVTALPASAVLPVGCGWEVANVKVEDAEESWWSVGFEAFGNEDERRNTLFSVSRHVLLAGQAPGLGLEDSYGYPRWLGCRGLSL